MEEIRSIKQAIIDGELENAIRLFLTFTESKFPEIHSELITISSQFKNIQSLNRTGIISVDNVQIAKSKISASLVQLLQKQKLQLEANETENQKFSYNKTQNTRQDASIDITQSSSIFFKGNAKNDEKKNSKRKILFLSANPKDSNRLRVDEEASKIEKGLIRAKYRDQFQLVTKWAVQVNDLQRHLLDENPNIVHFSGHGLADGLVFEDALGNSKLVKPEALSNLFELFSDIVECVVLNACYTEIQAEAIAKHINFVIGMNQDIPGDAAIAFAVAFYDALGAGRDPIFAYRLGCNSIQLYGIKGHLIPQLKRKAQ